MQIERLIALRKKAGLTQEALAEKFNVSRQAVQKWENGLSVPDIDNLILIAEFYGVTLDYLLIKDDKRSTEQKRLNTNFVPEYAAMNDWEMFSQGLEFEYEQCLDEGRNVAKYKNLFSSIIALPVGEAKERFADALFHMLGVFEEIPGYSFEEPDAYEDIYALSESFNKAFDKINVDKSKLYDKIKGAWIGRIAGCLLGKPIEAMKVSEFHNLLKKSNNYPMHRYILDSDITDEIIAESTFPLKNKCYGDVTKIAPADDDTNYTVLAQLIIDSNGADFTSKDVANAWVSKQPKTAYCTAERVAYVNFVNGYCPPYSALYKNPYREWIGAQIRADYYGYINPGNPLRAAKMAYKDACISHVRNGIYGAMYVAAMLAKAAVCCNTVEVVKTGLSVIPTTSRLYKNVSAVLADFEHGLTYDDFSKKLNERWDNTNAHHWLHVVSNAEIVAASILYGNLDYGKSICYAVQNGFDTDCNGATVGSIVGMMIGASSIPNYWSTPLGNKLQTSIVDVGTISIDELVNKTMYHIEITAQ